jgi:hypothetical protein
MVALELWRRPALRRRAISAAVRGLAVRHTLFSLNGRLSERDVPRTDAPWLVVAIDITAGLGALFATVSRCSARWRSRFRQKPSELKGGKFCEAVYSVINGAVRKNFPSKATKPSNMLEACRTLEKDPADSALVGDRSCAF